MLQISLQNHYVLQKLELVFLSLYIFFWKRNIKIRFLSQKFPKKKK